MKFRLMAATVFFVIVMVSVPVKAQIQTPLTPSDIRTAYDVNPLIQSGYTGKGVTVAIIGESIGPTFYSDVKTFSDKYGLPDPVISVVQPYGSGGTAKTDEIAADTELVHAMAPDAKILLVLVGSESTNDGFYYVIANDLADIATMSFYWWWWGSGAATNVVTYNDEYAKSVNEKITLISVSADFGSNNTVPWVASSTWTGDFWTKYLPYAYMMPQYSPYVTIVGGTALTAQSGTYSEVGWSQSGGGPSNYFLEPSWQTGPGVPQNGWRNIPDIALDASCNTPYAFDWNNDQETSFCGTSAAAPTFAGIIADIDQAAGGRVGFLNPTLYALGASDPSVYHEITSGCSLVQVGFPGSPESSTETGYCADAGWNFVTGWGSIDAAKLAKYLITNAKNVTTTSTTVSTSVSISSLMSTSSVTAATYTTASSLSTFALQNPMLSQSVTITLGVAVIIVAVLAAILALRKRGTKTQFCLNCGHKLPSGSLFCLNCGHRQET